MKAAAIILTSMGLFVLIKDTQAVLSKPQIEELGTWFNDKKDVIQRSKLELYLFNNQFKKFSFVQVQKFVKDLDQNSNGIELKELQDDEELADFLATRNGSAVETFFNNTKDAISKTAFQKYLLETGCCAEDDVDATYNKIDTNKDDSISWEVLFNPRIEAFAIKVAKLTIVKPTTLI